jgi:nucleoside-diphosphate-sugar epimerase
MTQIRHSYAVMGATGHIGSVVAECLLQTGNQARVVGRNTESLKGLIGQRAAVPRAYGSGDSSPRTCSMEIRCLSSLKERTLVFWAWFKVR